MKSRRVLSLIVVLAVLAGITTAAQQPAQQTPAQAGQRSPQEQRDIQALVQLVNDVSAGRQPAPADIAVTWDSNHFVRGQDGSTYIPFNLTVDATRLPAGAAIYTRVMTKEQVAAAATPPAAGQAAAPAQVRYPWDNINFTDAIPATGKISRAMALRPGEYEIFMAIKPKSVGEAPATPAPVQAGLLRRTITVPDFNATGLTTSSVIVATAIEDAPANMTTAQQQENPYVFGPLRIVPSMDGKLKKTGELQVLFWIYGPQQVSGKPNVEVQYNFHQRTPEGDKYFNKTAPQALNAQTLPPEFNMAEGHQLPGSLVVPLASFPAGDYRLEIVVTDKASGQTKTENVNFSVEA